MARPRITLLPADDWDDAVCGALSPLLPQARANPRDAGNVLGTLVRHPGLTRAYLEFNTYVLRGSTLSERVREVALLRAVQLRRCDYLWEHHIPIAQRAGLAITEIDAIQAGEPTDAVDAMVVRLLSAAGRRGERARHPVRGARLVPASLTARGRYENLLLKDENHVLT